MLRKHPDVVALVVLTLLLLAGASNPPVGFPAELALPGWSAPPVHIFATKVATLLGTLR